MKKEIPPVDIAIEAAGAANVAFDGMQILASNGVLCLLGLSCGSRTRRAACREDHPAACPGQPGRVWQRQCQPQTLRDGREGLHADRKEMAGRAESAHHDAAAVGSVQQLVQSARQRDQDDAGNNVVTNELKHRRRSGVPDLLASLGWGDAFDAQRKTKNEERKESLCHGRGDSPVCRRAVRSSRPLAPRRPTERWVGTWSTALVGRPQTPPMPGPPGPRSFHAKCVSGSAAAGNAAGCAAGWGHVRPAALHALHESDATSDRADEHRRNEGCGSC